MTVKTLILAAGQGTRMRSAQPKVLHQVARRSLLQHVYDTSRAVDENEIIIIYGHGGELVKQTLSELDAQWIPEFLAVAGLYGSNDNHYQVEDH